jgi:hypothetical protein
VTVRHTDDLCIATHRRDPSRPRRALDGLYLCEGCLAQLTGNLAQLPGLYAELAELLAVGGQAGQRVSGSPGRPLPINLGVAEHRGQIQAVLASWARVVVDERGITVPDSDEVAVTAPWLATHVTWFAGHQFADEVVHEIRKLTGRAHKLRDPDRRMTIGERCRVVPEGAERCPGTVAMVIGSDDLWSARCDVCGPQEAEPYLHNRLTGRWVTIDRLTSYALGRYGIQLAPATVRSWAARGNIGTEERGDRTWYDLPGADQRLRAMAERAAEMNKLLATYRDALKAELVHLWSDFAQNYHYSQASPPESSGGCESVIERILALTKIVGPVDAGELELWFLLSGMYERVHAQIGIHVTVPESMLQMARDRAAQGERIAG